MAKKLHQAGHNLLNPVRFSAEMPLTGPGKRVNLLPPTSILGPRTADKPFFLQPVEDRVQRPVAESKEPIAVGLNIQGDLVAVLRATSER